MSLCGGPSTRMRASSGLGFRVQGLELRDEGSVGVSGAIWGCKDA